MTTVLLLLAPRGVPGRWLGAVALAPLFVVAPAGPRMGALQVAVLDVGHGVAVLVRTARHALLYDTGPSFGPDADSGSRIIVPYLRAVGVKRLNGVIVSHDKDSPMTPTYFPYENNGFLVRCYPNESACIRSECV